MFFRGQVGEEDRPSLGPEEKPLPANGSGEGGSSKAATPCPRWNLGTQVASLRCPTLLTSTPMIRRLPRSGKRETIHSLNKSANFRWLAQSIAGDLTPVVQARGESADTREQPDYQLVPTPR